MKRALAIGGVGLLCGLGAGAWVGRHQLLTLASGEKATLPAGLSSGVAPKAPRPRAGESFESARARIHATFASQPRDQNWSSKTEKQLTDKVAELLQGKPNSQLLSVECRQSLCVLEASLPDVRAIAALQGPLVQQYDAFWKGAALFDDPAQSPDGRWVMRGFLAREGYPFESPAPSPRPHG